MQPHVTEAESAAYYNKTEDVSDFDATAPEPVTIRRNVTISVRFSTEEIEDLRARAEKQGVKVTSFIRAAALGASRPVDLVMLEELARDVEERAHAVAQFIAQGA